MKFNNPSTFDGKTVAKVSGNKIDAYDGSKLTGLKFTQLEDIGTPSGNKILITNANGNGLDYANVNFNAVKEIDITNLNSNVVTWDENNVCVVEHGLNGYVFTQVFDNAGDEIPLVKTYIDENHVSFYFENKPANNEIYKLICVSCGYTLENTSLSKNIKLGSCSNLGFYDNESGVSFSWTDPDDIELNGAILAEWDKTVLVRKEWGYPTNPSDGMIIATTSRSLINKNYYRDHSYTDETQESGKTYYYMLFSQTTAGEWNNLVANKFTNGIGLTWQQVGDFVEAGRGADLFPVGTTFIVEHPEYTTSTGIQGIAFRVVGHDQVPSADETLHHTMCLDMCEILFNAQYDAGELIYALTEDTITKANKTYYTYDGSEYTQLVEGTDYQVGDDVPLASYYEKNLINRQHGSNNFAESNLLQWANSDGSANLWFGKKTIFDTCGSVLNNKNGFLKHIDSNFLSVVKDAKLITAKNKEEGGGSSIVNAKFWPLSRTQVDGSLNNDVMENERLTYFESNSAVKTLNSAASIWWLRSPFIENTVGVYYVSDSGELTINSFALALNYANKVYGVSLACIVGKPSAMQFWKEVQKVVRSGKGPERYPVGTTFIVNHPEYTTSTGSQGIEFVVLGYDQVPTADETIQHTMCLGMSEILFNCQYDATEFEYALTEDTKTIDGKTYYTYDGSEYTQLVEGTDYQIGDDVPVASYFEKNLGDRGKHGSNNFEQSNLLQWANSDGSANLWFGKKTIFDTCGSVLNNKNGFLKYLDSNFLSVVKEAKLITSKCYEEGGGSSIVNAKFWPLSVTQVFGESNNGILENERLTYYANGNNVIKYLNGTATGWWLRSNNTTRSFIIKYCSNSGALSANNANNSFGVSLACIIG